MKTLTQGTLNVPASGIPTVGESVNALTEQVNNLQRRYYRALAPDCEVRSSSDRWNLAAIIKKPSAKVCYSKNFHHLCDALHFDKARMFASFTVGISCAQWLSYSSDPRVESLMASLPYQGVVQRESGTFFVPFPSSINQYIVSF